MKMNPMNESPPCKKLRLGESKSDLHSPLRIDTDRTRSVSSCTLTININLSMELLSLY